MLYKGENIMQNKSKMLMVSGNKIVYKDEPDKEVRLVGLNIAGLEWLIEDPFIEVHSRLQWIAGMQM